MLKMYHTHPETGASPNFWEDMWSDGAFEARLRFCDVDPLRPLFQRYSRRGAWMLEGGCGAGQYVSYYSALDLKVVGLDFARDSLRRLRDRQALKVCAGDVSALPFQSESFDLYYSGGVVEHFEGGAHEALIEARRVLRPGGVLLISVPYHSPLRRLLAWTRRHEWKRVTASTAAEEKASDGLRFFQYCYTPSEFSTMLAAAGLQVTARQGYSILWGLYDIPWLHRLGARLDSSLAETNSADGSQSLKAGPPSKRRVTQGGDWKTTLKRLVISEDDTLPLGGWFVRVGRWAFANMMMYVCIREA
jgi:SAM-dependent methyltransferase